jgi:hypothetical protein
MKGRLLAFVLLVLATGCHRQPAAGGGPAPNATTGDISVAPYDESSEKKSISAEAESDLKAGDYDKLEDLAQYYRSNLVAFPDGRSKLRYVYSGVAELDDDATDDAWTARIGDLKKWAGERQQTITAPVALAEAYVEYAWKARGSGLPELNNRADPAVWRSGNFFQSFRDWAQSQ